MRFRPIKKSWLSPKTGHPLHCIVMFCIVLCRSTTACNMTKLNIAHGPKTWSTTTRWVPNYVGMIKYLGEYTSKRGCVNIKNNLPLSYVYSKSFELFPFIQLVWLVLHCIIGTATEEDDSPPQFPRFDSRIPNWSLAKWLLINWGILRCLVMLYSVLFDSLRTNSV